MSGEELQGKSRERGNNREGTEKFDGFSAGSQNHGYSEVYTAQQERLYNSAKNRARNSNLEFSLEIEDIKIPEYCPLLGIKLTYRLGKGLLASQASIDRKDNLKGYIPGNVWIISHRANTMKSNADPAALRIFARNLLLQFGEQTNLPISY